MLSGMLTIRGPSIGMANGWDMAVASSRSRGRHRKRRGQMIDESAHGGRQPSPCGENDVDNAVLAAPAGEQPNQPAADQGIATGMVGQERHAYSSRRGIA